ncbi:unnamed protein product [Ceutorhynchus assimilis]|uniref:TRUD domain-containing protein n=1 Tax=Ceutorhynchus assimilis TaxID=467358 RepID=A0A9N9QP24_9CUCU|nr:unnamed protein product [Ceutorhynchus assimilis]
MSSRGGKRGGWQRRGRRGGKNFHNSNNFRDRKFEKREYIHKDQLTEDEVGISHYISKLDGYPAVIKARFSDFQVNEIDMEGRLVKLSDAVVPEQFLRAAPKESYQNTEESPLDKIPQNIWEDLKKLVTTEDGVPVELDAGALSKEDRKAIHLCVKSYFGPAVVASTVTADEKTNMVFKKPDSKAKDNRTPWPEDTPEFVHFILYKEMIDTMATCMKLSQSLGIPAAKISYAGVKDKRAKTTQWLCIKKYQPAKLLAKVRKIRNMRVGKFEFKEECLKIGDLKGNRFRIALRNVKADDTIINESLQHLKDNGFINYYGLQRFGNDKEVPTFSVGVKLLQGKWEEAVKLILKLKAGDDPTLPVNQAKKVYAETGDAETAIKCCEEDSSSIEMKLLEGLVKQHANNYVDALENVPRNMRLMYIHAFQSLIWNRMVSKRIKEFGFKPVEGDLIFVDNTLEDPVFEVEGDHEAETSEDEKENSRPEVRPLKADELEKYTIFDIVLPLPGFDVTYPENLKEFYKEAVEEFSLTLEMPKQKVRTYTLSGTYRKMIQQAKDLEWKIMYYNDPTDNLIRSDLEEVKGQKEPESVENGTFKGIVVAFTLTPSSYATMVLREFLKCNTSSSAQACLNNYGEKKEVLISVEENVKNDIEIAEVHKSLLSDAAKYESFKNNLFKDVLGEDNSESSTNSNNKRDLEGDEEAVDSKKTKIDTEI